MYNKPLIWRSAFNNYKCDCCTTSLIVSVDWLAGRGCDAVGGRVLQTISRLNAARRRSNQLPE